MTHGRRAARPLSMLVCALLLSSVSLFLQAAADADENPAILVVIDAGRGVAGIAAALDQEYPVTVGERRVLSTLNAVYLELTPHKKADPTRLLQRLQRDPRISDAQFNQQHRVAAMPGKDPYFDLQTRTRRGGVGSILRRGSGRNVRIAVIDTGVDVEHPDLRGQLAATANFVGSAADLVPGEFHGTAVVGLISARPGNGIGIHGIAPDAEVLALRACWEPTYGYGLCSTNTLAQALDYAIDVRARIINLSLAGPEDPLLERLVERAIELGAVVFGAVGEDDSQPFPASIDGVIAVEQGAPGTLPVIGSRLNVPGRQLLSTVPDSRYDFVSGSSFATAHASGVAAVMLELQPHLRADDLVDWLQRLHENQPKP